MSKRISEFTGPLSPAGRLRVTDRGFLELLNTDLKELEIASSLRKLGNTKVMEWDFKTSLPAVHKFAHQEVDVVGWMKRVAHYRVMEWDFRTARGRDGEAEAGVVNRKIPEPWEMEDLVARLKAFLQFVVVNLIDEPDRAQIRVQEIAPGVVSFKLVITQKDQALLVRKDGATASALRNMMKGIAAAEGVHVLLQILTHQEDLALGLREAEGK